MRICIDRFSNFITFLVAFQRKCHFLYLVSVFWRAHTFLESRCSTFIHITFRCGRLRPAAPLVAFIPGAKGTAAHSAVQGKRLAIRTIGDF